MASPTIEPRPTDLSWLGDVREVSQPLSRLRPIWIRENRVLTGPPPPQPTVPHPERHPYCEFGIGMEGAGIQYIGREQLLSRPGQVMLLGPGVPHNGELHRYPARGVTVYFLPILLLDMGPSGDGVRVLSRFTAEQSIHQRVISPPPALWGRLKRGGLEMLAEFRSGGFGSELRLRALLMELLVALMRWEEKSGRRIAPTTEPLNWPQIQKALHYLQEHHAEPIYVQQVARAVGISESRLKAVFRESVGMSCVQYLKAYRISLAAAKLNATKDSITEVALAVGFETLSHFNTTFRDLIGMSPTEYIRSKS